MCKPWRFLDEKKADKVSAFSSEPTLCAFSAHRINSSTFLIKELDDMWELHPYVYVKIVPAAQTILVFDTGCGGRTTNPDVEVRNLRKFIETVSVNDNGGEPLNPGGKLSYVVVLSHCHFDHILGIAPFAVDSPILGSSHDPVFVAPENLAKNSLCDNISIRPPSYKLQLVPNFHSVTSTFGNVPLGITVLHTPGHTPDSLALWDEEESMLFVADTVYEDDVMFFSEEASLPTWFTTIDMLLSFVRSQPDPSKVKISCGHLTVNKPAIDVLAGAKKFMNEVISGKLKLNARFRWACIWMVQYGQESGPFSMIAAESIISEARRAASQTRWRLWVQSARSYLSRRLRSLLCP